MRTALLCLFAVVVVALVVSAADGAAPWSDLEQARLDAIAQEGRALDAEQRVLTLMRENWTRKVATFKTEAEAKRPGWTWDPDTGKWAEKPKEK